MAYCEYYSLCDITGPRRPWKVELSRGGKTTAGGEGQVPDCGMWGGLVISLKTWSREAKGGRGWRIVETRQVEP